MSYHSTAHVAITSLIFNDFIKICPKIFFFFGCFNLLDTKKYVNKKEKYYLITLKFKLSLKAAGSHENKNRHRLNVREMLLRHCTCVLLRKSNENWGKYSSQIEQQKQEDIPRTECWCNRPWTIRLHSFFALNIDHENKRQFCLISSSSVQTIDAFTKHFPKDA